MQNHCVTGALTTTRDSSHRNGHTEEQLQNPEKTCKIRFACGHEKPSKKPLENQKQNHCIKLSEIQIIGRSFS